MSGLDRVHFWLARISVGVAALAVAAGFISKLAGVAWWMLPQSYLRLVAVALLFAIFFGVEILVSAAVKQLER